MVNSRRACEGGLCSTEYHPACIGKLFTALLVGSALNTICYCILTVLRIWNENAPKIIINNTINLFLKLQSAFR